MIKILLVDDDPVSTALLQNLMKPYGHSDIVNDSQKVVDMCRDALNKNAPYDIIFLDIMMPGLDGHQLLSAIRTLESEMQKGHKSKIFMASALDDTEHVMDSFMADCQEYITKPFSGPELYRKMDKYGFVKEC